MILNLWVEGESELRECKKLDNQLTAAKVTISLENIHNNLSDFKKAIDEAMAQQAEFEAKSTEKERRWLLIERRARNGGSDSTTETSNSHLDLAQKGESIKSQSENLETFFKDSPMLKPGFKISGEGNSEHRTVSSDPSKHAREFRLEFLEKPYSKSEFTRMRTISFNIQLNATGMAHNIPPVKSYSLQDYKDLFNISLATAEQTKIEEFKLQNRPVHQRRRKFSGKFLQGVSHALLYIL